ncbi:MAG: hypothetical protein IJT18_07745, partial [Oscillospiraceae bacterium]|nr:hypothetical protein [Oscillospiraceae bacterium]
AKDVTFVPSYLDFGTFVRSFCWRNDLFRSAEQIISLCGVAAKYHVCRKANISHLAKRDISLFFQQNSTVIPCKFFHPILKYMGYFETLFSFFANSP